MQRSLYNYGDTFHGDYDVNGYPDLWKGFVLIQQVKKNLQQFPLSFPTSELNGLYFPLFPFIPSQDAISFHLTNEEVGDINLKC